MLQDATARQMEGQFDEVFRIVRPDGQVRWIRDRAFPVRDASGAVVRIAGVAHDFNNWLTVIFGYTEVLADRLREDSFATQALDEIRRAGERASSLTR